MTRVICLVFLGNHLSAALTQQQQQGSVETTRAATGNVNNFINRPRPPLIEQKHTNNMEKHFLFLMSPCRCRPLSSEGRISSLSVTGIENDKHCALIDGQLRCLLYRQMTHATALNLHFLPGLSVRLK